MQQAVGYGYEEWGADRLLTVGILREEGRRSDRGGKEEVEFLDERRSRRRRRRRKKKRRRRKRS
jgi:hypothetical protein